MQLNAPKFRITVFLADLSVNAPGMQVVLSRSTGLPYRYGIGWIGVGLPLGCNAVRAVFRADRASVLLPGYTRTLSN